MSELYIYQNARCNNKNRIWLVYEVDSFVLHKTAVYSYSFCSFLRESASMLTQQDSLRTATPLRDSHAVTKFQTNMQCGWLDQGRESATIIAGRCSRLLPRPILQQTNQWVMGFPGGKSGRNGMITTPYSTKDEWIFTSTPPARLCGTHRNNGNYVFVTNCAVNGAGIAQSV